METGLAVKKSRNGQGIFTAQNFGTGAVAYEVRGTRFHYTTLLAKGGTFLDNCFRISENYYLSPEGYIGVYQNHSCTPNARVEKRGKRLFVVAFSPIRTGEEVLIDYSTITAGDDIWTMPCNCGESPCRKVIRTWTKLPRPLQQRYMQERVLPKYMQNLER